MSTRLLIAALVATVAGCQSESRTTPQVSTTEAIRVYVSNERSGDLSVIDPQTQTVVDTIPVGKRPRGIRLSRDNRTLFVALSGSPIETAGAISVIDVKTQKVLREIQPVGQNVRPMGVVISPDARRAYVTTGRGGSVVEIDTASDSVVRTLRDVGTRPWGIGITPDGKLLCTANGPSDDVTVIDVSEVSIKSKIRCGRSPWGIAISN